MLKVTFAVHVRKNLARAQQRRARRTRGKRVSSPYCPITDAFSFPGVPRLVGTWSWSRRRSKKAVNCAGSGCIAIGSIHGVARPTRCMNGDLSGRNLSIWKHKPTLQLDGEE